VIAIKAGTLLTQPHPQIPLNPLFTSVSADLLGFVVTLVIMAILVDRHYQFQRLVENDMTNRADIDEDLQSLIEESQSRRLDDQRTPLPDSQDLFLNLLAQMQSARMEDQRASLHLMDSSVSNRTSIISMEDEKPQTEEEFLDLVFHCQVNEQRRII
jgi:hypothetical protein